MPWKDFSIVGKLPKLKSLKLSYTFFIDGEWEVSGEGFPYLKFVLLEYLNIRYGRANITTLALIDICRCAQSVGNSAKQIQQDMEDNYASSIEILGFHFYPLLSAGQNRSSSSLKETLIQSSPVREAIFKFTTSQSV
ncbi:hypothetical protein KY289_035845 [Solanum tuberosum]|nr:hypothetical protein KY289_035845 [Solanum tuberosum]